MRGIGKQWIAAVVLAGWMGCAASAVITEGVLSGESRISGRFGPGDMSTVLKKFSQGLDRPLLLGVDAGSAPVAVMQLADWLRAQRPLLDVDDACTGSCAWLLVSTGRGLDVRRGAFIAFDTASALQLFEVVRQRIEAGELFTDASASAASRQRLQDKVKAIFADAHAYDLQVRKLWPAPMLAFVEALRGPLNKPELVFDDERVNIAFDGDRPRCLWWVPDAQGLRQIGLDLPGFQPPPRERLAKQLNVNAAQIYVGPMLEAQPAQGLCAQAKEMK